MRGSTAFLKKSSKKLFLHSTRRVTNKFLKYAVLILFLISSFMIARPVNANSPSLGNLPSASGISLSKLDQACSSKIQDMANFCRGYVQSALDAMSSAAEIAQLNGTSSGGGLTYCIPPWLTIDQVVAGLVPTLNGAVTTLLGANKTGQASITPDQILAAVYMNKLLTKAFPC